MLKKLIRKRIAHRRMNETTSDKANVTNTSADDIIINDNSEDTLTRILNLLGDPEDLITRRFHIFGEYPAMMLCFSNLVNPPDVHTDVLRAMMHKSSPSGKEVHDLAHLQHILYHETLYHTNVTLEKSVQTLVKALLRGDTLVVIDGLTEVFLIGTKQIEKRSIDQPKSEQIIRGPHEGFIERIDTNIALLRYRLQSPDLRIDKMELGSRAPSRVVICYMKGLVNPDLVDEVKKRLSYIDIDAIMDTGYIEQFIEDHYFSPFPQVLNTERPDKVVANMLEGRVAIMVDGSPISLIVPAVFNQFYQSVEDYTERFLWTSAIRMIRLVSIIFSLVFPSLYVAIISFNPELIPTEFAVAVAGGRATVPYPAIVEILIMEICMEVLREATLRLPQQIGGALSIVGVLVIGQAAVAAGFASPITVVIIALTTIGSFATPSYNMALAFRLLRFPLMFFSGLFGLFGVMIGLILIVNHMISLKSFGVPYMSPIVPGNSQGWKDSLFRAPLWTLKRRPFYLHTQDQVALNSHKAEELQETKENALDPAKFRK